MAVATKTITETPRVKMKRVYRYSNGMSTTCHNAIPHNTVREMGWHLHHMLAAMYGGR